MEKLSISVTELSKVLGVSKPIAYRLANSKGFPVLQIGRRKVIPVKNLEKWLEENTGFAGGAGIQTDRNGNIVPVKAQSAKQRIDGTASLLDAYVGLYEHFNEFKNAL